MLVRVGGQRWYLCLSRGGVMAGGVPAAAHQPVHQADEWHLVGCGLAGAKGSALEHSWVALDSGWGGSPAPPVDSFVSLFLCFVGLFCLGSSCL